MSLLSYNQAGSQLYQNSQEIKDKSSNLILSV